jgi:glycerol-1-phosphate dehydrogenase [NAD(P)+]
MTLRNDRALVDRALAEASTTRRVEIRSGALADVGPIALDAFPDRIPVIVADTTTFGIAGEAVLASLRDAGMTVAEPIVFPGEPTLRPDVRHVARIRQHLGPTSLPVAVGSGTLNDLTKRAAFESGLPYLVAGTAASMDGYTASGAALIADGVKQTFECPAPEVVIVDLDIIAAAPEGMTASGYGDLIGKVTAGADWILADALEIEPILPNVWQMVQGPLPDMIAEPERYFRGGGDAIEPLLQGLIITGLAIQAAGTTRTASGSEHQFSHLWEMRGLEHDGEVVSHGKKVGLGTIVSTSLYERLLAYPVAELDIDRAVAAWPSWPEMEAMIPRTLDHAALVAKALDECRAKHVTPDQLRDRLTLLRDRWPDLAPRLRDQLLPIDELRHLLARAHCPTRPEEIGLDVAQLRESYFAAGQIRRRYTVFDVVLEAGLLEPFVSEIFGPAGHWATREGVTG